MSKAAGSPGEIIETSTPVHEASGDQSKERLNHLLYEVIPGCMTDVAKAAFIRQDMRTFDPTTLPDTKKYYLFHVESGMRVYELYSLIDISEDENDNKSLAAYVRDNKGALDRSYFGPWALETMGGDPLGFFGPFPALVFGVH